MHSRVPEIADTVLSSQRMEAAAVACRLSLPDRRRNNHPHHPVVYSRAFGTRRALHPGYSSGPNKARLHDPPPTLFAPPPPHNRLGAPWLEPLLPHRRLAAASPFAASPSRHMRRRGSARRPNPGRPPPAQMRVDGGAGLAPSTPPAQRVRCGRHRACSCVKRGVLGRAQHGVGRSASDGW